VNERCPFCKKEISPNDVYCSGCGNKLPDREAPFTTTQKIKMYFLSIVLAPFGLYWFFKYFKDPNTEKKKVAYSILYISIFMVVVLVIVNYFFIKSLTNSIEMYTTEGLYF
jgi:uncharacterized membrane protein YvbJ